MYEYRPFDLHVSPESKLPALCSVHSKAIKDMNLAICLGGQMYRFSDQEFRGLLNYTNDFPGRACIEGKPIHSVRRRGSNPVNVAPLPL